MKHLEVDKFFWPQKKKGTESVSVTQRELSWLPDGLELKQKAHKKLNHETVL
ncbi:MAG: transposase [Proteobacteria bacterium]|nr:transposase [Pseudomonadota bacterium]